MAIAADKRAGLVRLDFGKPVAWLGLPHRQTMELANKLIAKADELVE